MSVYSQAEIAGTGMPNIIPDHILMPPTQEEYGLAERYFILAYSEYISVAISKLTVPMQRELASKIGTQIMAGAFSWGSTSFQAFGLTESGMLVLEWLCLRRQHAQYQKPEDILPVLRRLTAKQRDEARGATMLLWGYRSKEPGQSEASDKIDWAQVYRKCVLPAEQGGLGLAPDQFKKLTMPQLMALLSTVEYDTPDQLKKIMDDSAARYFDVIAEENKLEPEEVEAMPDDQLLAAVKAKITKPGPVDISIVRKMLKEWVASKAA